MTRGLQPLVPFKQRNPNIRLKNPHEADARHGKAFDPFLFDQTRHVSRDDEAGARPRVPSTLFNLLPQYSPIPLPQNGSFARPRGCRRSVKEGFLCWKFPITSYVMLWTNLRIFVLRISLIYVHFLGEARGLN